MTFTRIAIAPWMVWGDSKRLITARDMLSNDEPQSAMLYLFQSFTLFYNNTTLKVSRTSAYSPMKSKCRPSNLVPASNDVDLHVEWMEIYF